MNINLEEICLYLDVVSKDIHQLYCVLLNFFGECQGGWIIGYFNLYIYIYIYIFGEGNGTPLQYSCLENPMDGGAC